MKKVVLLISVIFISIGIVSAQRGKVNSVISFVERGELDKAKEALDEALEHSRTVDWPRTYYAKGRLAQEVAQTDNRRYSNLMGSTPLIEAYDAYMKALELDNRATTKNTLMLNNTFTVLGNQFINHAVSRWESNDFKGALTSFEYFIEIAQHEIYLGGDLDTVFFYNAGLAALYAEEYDKAIEYFEICIESNHEGANPYTNIYQAYLAQGKIDEAEETLKRAIEAYPEDEDLLLALIQLYLDTEQTDNAYNYIDIAIEKSPDNGSLYLAKGTIFLDEESEYYDPEKAIVELLKATELDEESWAAFYNLGIAYYNLAVDTRNIAVNIEDVFSEEYESNIKLMEEYYQKAQPPLEKAHELNPDELDVMKTLRSVYYVNYSPTHEKYVELDKKIGGR